MSAITFLPSLVISKILSSLSPRDMKSAVLVCKMWREVGESSSLWSWAMVKICPGDVGHILNSRRLQIVQEINLYDPDGDWSDSEEVEQLLQTLGRCQKLKIIQGLGHLPLSGVKERIVSCLVNKVEEISMGYYAMPETAKTILSVIRQDTQLRRIYCRYTDLSSIQPDSLATVVHRMVDVWLYDTRLEPAQLTAILLKIDETSKLKYLNIGDSNCSSVKPDIMANVNKLEKVWISNADLTTVQITCILTQAVENTMLKLLDCSDNNCDDVDQELVREAEQKIAEFIHNYLHYDDDYIML